MKRISAVALAAIALASTPAVAADLFGTAPPPMTMPASDAASAVEVGSNWYIRGDVGASLDYAPTISLDNFTPPPPPGNASTPLSPTVGSNQFSRDFTADLGVGYRVNNYLRLEATYDYRTGPGGSNTNTVICPYGLYGESTQVTPANPTSIELGYLYNPTNTCNGVLSVKQTNNMGLASAYLDLGTYWGFTPYVGAGVGLNANTLTGNLNYYQTSNGAIYNANLTPTGTYPQIWVNTAGVAVDSSGAVLGTSNLKAPNIAFNQQNWNRTINQTKYTMAWALSLGVGYQLTPSATLDVGYRYVNTGTNQSVLNPSTGMVMKMNNTSQEVRIGIRYMAD